MSQLLELIPPSGAERNKWPETTRQYVNALEINYAMILKVLENMPCGIEDLLDDGTE